MTYLDKDRNRRLRRDEYVDSTGAIRKEKIQEVEEVTKTINLNNYGNIPWLFQGGGFVDIDEIKTPIESSKELNLKLNKIKETINEKIQKLKRIQSMCEEEEKKYETLCEKRQQADKILDRLIIECREMSKHSFRKYEINKMLDNFIHKPEDSVHDGLNEWLCDLHEVM